MFEDDAMDTLTGSAGQDWFYVRLTGTNIDRITDVQNSELGELI